MKANLNNLFEKLGEMAKEEGLSNVLELGKIPLKLKQTPINVDDFENDETSKLLFAGLSNDDSLWDSCTKLFDNFGKFMFDSDFYKQVRESVKKQYKHNLNSSIQEPSQIFEKVDGLMSELSKNDRKKLKDTIIEVIKNQNDPTDFKIFISIYLTLDLMGVRSDSLKDKNNTPLNIISERK